jgi:hypothetical protein
MSPSLRNASLIRLRVVMDMYRETETSSRVQMVWNEWSAASLGATRVVLACSDAQSRLEYAPGNNRHLGGNRGEELFAMMARSERGQVKDKMTGKERD